MATKTITQLELLVEKYAAMTARDIEIALSKDRADADDSSDHDADTCNAEDCPMDHEESTKKTSAGNLRIAKARHKVAVDEVEKLWEDQGRLRKLHSESFLTTLAEKLAIKHSI